MASLFENLPLQVRKKVLISGNGCWVWTGSKTDKGYGQLYVSRSPRKTIYVHRLSFSLLVGELIDGMELDHKCRNPSCCNPDHLEQVTHAENVRRGMAWAINGTKTHCLRGHEFTPENTIVEASGSRRCKACKREKGRNWMRKRRSQLAEEAINGNV